MNGILVYAGNGAVGTTTCAAATGVALARDGTETVVVSFDPLGSLSDAFRTEVGPEPTSLRSGLTGVEISPESGQETYSELFAAIADELGHVGLDLDDGHVAEFVGSQKIPLGREVAALEAVAAFVRDPDYETVVFDTGPNGRILRLLRTPGMLGQGVDAAQELTDQLELLVRDATARVPDPLAWGSERVGTSGDGSGSDARGPTSGESEPEPAADEEIEGRIESVRSVVGGAGRRQLRVVTTPEEVAVRYTDYLVANVTNAGIPAGPLIVNQVLEDPDPDCARCQERYRRQQGTIESLRSDVEELEVRCLPDCRGRADGVEMLELLADRIPS